ncbi:MAG: membrane protein insertase YidC [Deltaproteobacteria bacterium]|nr:membrane protein insertase YidC [Deltaproteobacteria bacterium]
MEKRALIAVILSLLVLYFFQAYFFSPERTASRPTENHQKENFHNEDQPALTETGVGIVERELLIPAAEASSEKEIKIITSLYDAVLTTRGGDLKSFLLKRYLDDLGSDSAPIEMVGGKDRRIPALRTSLVGENGVFPLDMVFEADRDLVDLSSGEEAGSVVFTGMTAEGIAIRKIVTFFPHDYRMNVEIEVSYLPSSSPPKEVVSSWVKTLDPDEGSSRLGFTGPAALVSGELKEIKVKSLDEGSKTFSNQVEWAGYEDKYFLAAFFPLPGSSLGVDVSKPAADAIVINCITAARSTDGADKAFYSYGFYCGPKDIEVLKSLGVGLEKAIDFGMFDIIAKPLLYTLKYLNKTTNNYGWAIIILTIIIKIIFFPLTHKSYKSMKAMKDLQPLMAELRKKYKDDKERLNRETMNLYRTYKVNPLGGCLPLLIQFPIFIAFYWVLLGSIELRHAPFMLWIKDLSAQDPYYVTPILMGASMFIQQKMTPTAGDPTQAKVMLAMPIVFTFLFLKFPSGLVIYWLVNNILQIFQQLYIDKRVS